MRENPTCARCGLAVSQDGWLRDSAPPGTSPVRTSACKPPSRVHRRISSPGICVARVSCRVSYPRIREGPAELQRVQERNRSEDAKRGVNQAPAERYLTNGATDERQYRDESACGQAGVDQPNIFDGINERPNEEQRDDQM